MAKKLGVRFTVQADGRDFFVELENGLRIAKRGRPGTPHAKTWIPLEPGWRVLDLPDSAEITVEYDPPDAA
jgi:hypothetical protein